MFCFFRDFPRIFFFLGMTNVRAFCGGFSQVSGGLHNDMAVHDFDMARFLVGSEVTEVYCKGSCKVRKSKCIS